MEKGKRRRSTRVLKILGGDYLRLTGNRGIRIMRVMTGSSPGPLTSNPIVVKILQEV